MIDQRIKQLEAEINFAESKLKNNLRSIDSEVIFKSIYELLPFTNQNESPSTEISLFNGYVNPVIGSKFNIRSFILKQFLKLLR